MNDPVAMIFGADFCSHTAVLEAVRQAGLADLHGDYILPKGDFR